MEKKRVFLIGATTIAMTVPGVAGAQLFGLGGFGGGMVVNDPMTHILQQTQLGQLVAEVAQAVATVEQLKIVVSSLMHNTNYGSIIAELQTAGLQSPMPPNPQMIEAGLAGQSVGYSGPMAAQYQARVAANTVYVQDDGSWGAQEVQRRINSVSAAQAAGDTMYQAAADRLPATQALMDQINTTGDAQSSLSLIARVDGENAISATQNTQAMATWLQLSQAKEAEEVRERQMVAQSNDTWIAEAKAEFGL